MLTHLDILFIAVECNAVSHVKEVAAGDTEDLQVSIVRRPECIQIWVLAGESSVGCNVDQHHNLAAVLRERHIPGPVQDCHLVVVEASLALPAGGHGQAQQAAGQQGQHACQVNS